MMDEQKQILSTFNRTTVECKCTCWGRERKWIKPFNRTTVECKWR